MTVPCLARVTFSNVSALAVDETVCDFAFLAADKTSGTWDSIRNSISDFFNTNHVGQTHELAYAMSTELARTANGVTVQAYDLTGHLDGTPHGSPFYTSTWTLAASGGSPNMVSEAAIAITWWANGYATTPETAPNPSPPPATIRPKARLRGRIYWGPLTDFTVVYDASHRARVSPSTIADIGYASAAFMLSRGGDFAVWSRADAQLHLVGGGGRITVDNAFDTQRKRGPKPTLRTVVWP